MLLLAAFLGIIVFLPAEGRLSGPLHAALAALLGRAAFAVPVGCAFVGVVVLVRTLRPRVVLPARRLAGVALLFVGVVVAEQLLATDHDGAGLVGEWLSSMILDLLGPAVTGLLVITGLVVGGALAFGLNLNFKRHRQAEPDAVAEN